VRIATFNLENFDETDPGERPSLDERIALMRPQITRLRADMACFQEVHGQEQAGQPRALLALRSLLKATNLDDAELVSTEAFDGGVLDERNLVVAAHHRIAAHEQIHNKFVAQPPGPLVGRTVELDLLRGLLPDPDTRLVTLTGPPGVGKTRLSLAAAAAAAADFADGAIFIDLTTVRDPDLVPAEIAGAHGQETGAVTGGRLFQALAGKQILVVLDNFEHVLPAAGWLGDLLAAYPGLTVLVTSRERLHLRAEREVYVPPLTLPGPTEIDDAGLLAASPAVALLVRHVRSFDPAF
jgi:hypothetical protein